MRIVHGESAQHAVNRRCDQPRIYLCFDVHIRACNQGSIQKYIYNVRDSTANWCVYWFNVERSTLICYIDGSHIFFKYNFLSIFFSILILK